MNLLHFSAQPFTQHVSVLLLSLCDVTVSWDLVQLLFSFERKIVKLNQLELQLLECPESVGDGVSEAAEQGVFLLVHSQSSVSALSV